MHATCYTPHTQLRFSGVSGFTSNQLLLKEEDEAYKDARVLAGLLYWGLDEEFRSEKDYHSNLDNIHPRLR